MSQTIGERIKQVRGSMGVGDFAAALGVNRKTVTRWESDGSIPDGASLLALRKLFGVDPSWLLTGEGSAPLLQPDEAALLDNYRHCPPEGKAALKTTSAALAQQKDKRNTAAGGE